MPQRPPRIRIRLPYTATILLGNGAAGSAAHVFSLSDPFDPDVTGTGGVPIGYTAWNAQYIYRVCHSASVKCSFNIRDTEVASGAAANVIAGAAWNDTNVQPVLADFDTEDELRRRALQRSAGMQWWWRKMVRTPNGTNAAGSGSRGGSMWTKPFKRFFANTALTAHDPYGKVTTRTAPSDPYGVTNQGGFVGPAFSKYISFFAFGLPQDGVAAGGVGGLNMPYVYCTITIWYDIEYYGPVYDA